jgi:hypothetical protein
VWKEGLPNGLARLPSLEPSERNLFRQRGTSREQSFCRISQTRQHRRDIAVFWLPEHGYTDSRELSVQPDLSPRDDGLGSRRRLPLPPEAYSGRTCGGSYARVVPEAQSLHRRWVSG